MRKKKNMIFWALMFVGALLLLSQIERSDGDDAFFYQYANEMGLLEYVSWRYRTWVGRLAGETLVYLTFRRSLWFWRVVNAAMLALLSAGVLRLSMAAARLPIAHGTYALRVSGEPAYETRRILAAPFGASLLAAAGYFLMDIQTVGYAAIWINGSIFYTWTFACGIWALVPVADCVFCDNGDAARGGHFFFTSIPLAVVASMSIEQMGAVLLAFECLAAGYLVWKRRKVPALLFLQTGVTAAAFAVLFLAPGNALRIASEIANWMPQYADLTVGEHVFLTVQWLLSSFANENRLFPAGMLGVGIALLWQEKESGGWGKIVWTATAGVFFVSTILPCLGVTGLTDLGLGAIQEDVCVTSVPTLGQLTGAQLAAMLWWAGALAFCFAFLWRTSGGQAALLLAYLAGIASEAILYFSPTIYASGERVYYLTDLLYLFLLLCLTAGLRGAKRRNAAYVILIAAGGFHFLSQIQEALAMFA